MSRAGLLSLFLPYLSQFQRRAVDLGSSKFYGLPGFLTSDVSEGIMSLHHGRVALRARVLTALLAFVVAHVAIANADTRVDLLTTFDATAMSPAAPLIQGADGNFYGTTSQGGPGNAGTIFRISPAGTLTVLYAFSG